MPNICSFSMKIIGKSEAVREMVQVVKADYDYTKNQFSFNRHLWRVFEADVTEENYVNDGNSYVIINGECAWSISSCMLDGPHSYQNQHKNDENNKGTDLQTESRNLGVIIEVYSSEPSVGFQEHYLIENGEMKTDECVVYEEYFWDQDEYTIEEYNKEYDTDFTEDMFDEDGCCGVGGFTSWEFAQ